MARKNTKIQLWRKQLKSPQVIYLYLECLIEKILFCLYIQKYSYAVKKSKHTASGWPMFIKFLFDGNKKIFDYFRVTNSIKELYKKVKDYAVEIINYA